MSGIPRFQAGIPDESQCATCGQTLSEPFGWCSNCRLAYCEACGRSHYCQPTCQAAGCLAGFCLRTVDAGLLSTKWRHPESVRKPAADQVNTVP